MLLYIGKAAQAVKREPIDAAGPIFAMDVWSELPKVWADSPIWKGYSHSAQRLM